MLTSREATEVPRLGSGYPFIAANIKRKLRSRSPQNAQHFIIGASVSEPPLVDSTDTLSRYIYIYRRAPLLRMRGATRKRSRPDRESSQSS